MISISDTDRVIDFPRRYAAHEQITGSGKKTLRISIYRGRLHGADIKYPIGGARDDVVRANVVRNRAQK